MEAIMEDMVTTVGDIMDITMERGRLSQPSTIIMDMEDMDTDMAMDTDTDMDMLSILMTMQTMSTEVIMVGMATIVELMQDTMGITIAGGKPDKSHESTMFPRKMFECIPYKNLIKT